MKDEVRSTIKDKVVLITGSTGPMGLALVDAFLNAGAGLALCVRRMAHLPELEKRLRAQEKHAMIVPCDLRYEENVVRLIHRVVQRYGRIDVIINAALICGPRLAVIDYPADPWRDVIATNVTGAYLVCREALPWMTRQGSGSIINVTSSPTTSTRSKWGAYLVGNHAIEGLTKLLAVELKETGVRVNTVDIGLLTPELKPVMPGTDWTKAFLWLAGDESAGQNGERIQAADFTDEG